LLPDEREALAYELASESFELYVPGTLEPGAAAAGLIWVSAGGDGAPPRAWAAVLDRLHVTWIGANGSGNRRSPADRVNLALDASAHLRGLLGDHPDLYVGGFSGGARIASEAALLYPDVFSGGLFVGAADYFRFVRSSDPRWSAWEPTFPPPSRALLQLPRTRGRYLLFSGDRDSNRTLVRDVHRAMLEDGIAAAEYLEIPDLGHEMPSAPLFERALVRLLSGVD